MSTGLTHAGERGVIPTLRRSSIPGAPRPQAISNSRRISASLATELIVVILGSLVFDGEKWFALESKAVLLEFLPDSAETKIGSHTCQTLPYTVVVGHTTTLARERPGWL